MEHQPNTYATALEQIEQMIERLEPGSTIRLADITGRFDKENRSGDVTKAAIMLLKKYGISFYEGDE